MQGFGIIEERALEKHGEEKLKERLLTPATPEELTRIPADRWLAEATKSIFQSGFSWSLIEKKWPNFEAVFHGFDVHRCAMQTEEDMDRWLSDTGIVRNGMKLATIAPNAVFFKDLISEHGGVGAFFGAWKTEDYFVNMDALKKRTKRLGGRTGQIFVRRMGVPSIILSQDVVKALIGAGIVEKEPTSKRDQKAVQDAVNVWQDESGRNLTQISQILALSV